MDILFQQTRGMATEKQILLQINATKNIKKITSSMKMVSAAKLKGDELRLTLAKPFNAWTTRLAGEPTLVEGATYEDIPQKTLIVPFTSERGLCGGINSFITRNVKVLVTKLAEQGKECDIAIVGEKGRTQLRRVQGEKIIRSMTDIQSPGTYGLAAGLATEIMAAGAADYDAILVMYNHYVNPAVYKQMYQLIAPLAGEGEDDETLFGHEFDGDKSELMVDLYEYMLASQLYYTFMDAAAAEQSSRMAAMENASKNAGEMIDSLTLKYNRARQARITTELIEIISGASAIDEE